MFLLKILFWVSIFLVVYTYVAYGFVLYGLLLFKRIFKSKNIEFDDEFLPDVTFVVAAYNEEQWIESKIQNCLNFDYPKDKIQFLFVTDGSTDSTPDIIRNRKYERDQDVRVYHSDDRRGKIAAVERIMEFVNTPIVIYTDANTDVNPQAIRKIVRHYENPKVGGVAGEKRIRIPEKGAANSAGEGIYWKYESKLKEWDSEFYSVVGAAGELFSIRTELYEPIPEDTVIEDFYLTLRIAQQGYRIRYEPEAFAVESSSASVGEELKRKIRIAAGGLQAISRLTPLLNIFKYGRLSFSYISHRVLRWTLAPMALPIILITNIILAISGGILYKIILACQIAFYAMAFIGYILEKKEIKFKAFFVPYYFCVMNYAVYKGYGRHMKGSQSVVWEKAKRADEVEMTAKKKETKVKI